MKKSIFFIVLILGTWWQTNAQIQKGTRTIGGSIGFSSSSTTNTISSSLTPSKESSSSATQLYFAPKGGIMVTDEIMVGADVQFSLSSSGKSSSTTTIGFMPFGRYYFPSGDKFYFFGEVALGFGSSSSGGVSNSLTQWKIGPGASYFLTDNVSIEATLHYNSTKYKDISEAYNSTTLGIGLQYYF